MGVLTRGETRRRWILLAAALGLAFAMVVIVPIGSSRAEVTVEEDAGVLLLRVDSDGDSWVRYYAEPTFPLLVDGPGAPEPDGQQDLGIDNKCSVTSSGDALVVFTGGSRGVGGVSNGLGAKTKNNCSTAQGQIVSASDESLTIALGDFFSEQMLISGGEVDVEGKGGTNLGATYTSGAEEITLENSKDNGPDSGIGDNEIAVLSPAVGSRSVTFTATDGKVAIEGGGDGTIAGGSLRSSLGVNETVFELTNVREYDAGDLICGDTDVGPTATPNENGPAEVIELGRSENLKPGECTEVEYTFRIEADSVLFDANLDDQPSAHFVIRVEWDPVDVMPEGTLFDPPVRQIQFAPGQPYEDVHACTGLIDAGETVPREGLEDPLLDNVYGHPIGLYGQFAGETVPWCLAGEQLVLLESGKWQQIQWYDGIGPDPRFQ